MNDEGARQSPAATSRINRSDRSESGGGMSGADIDFTIADEIAADPSGRAAIQHRLLALARDVGTLRRRFASNENAWTGAWAAERIADHVETLDVMVGLSAGQIVACSAPGDADAVEEALRIVDERQRTLRARLGRKAL
jgi:hypothetical protein